ncbi:hypothetical protein EDC04DRAFT_2901326 [Pisolithus marmoratus]|nr:hypothetical protein EDC04DRAFT_2901326 [Pisolithus marmoratus]
MDKVESKIKEDLSMVKHSIVNFMKNLQASADMHALEKAEISLTIDWDVIQQRATQQVPLGVQDAPAVLEAAAVVPLPTPGTGHPIHNHHLSCCYHDDSTGTALDSDEGENINIHVDSDGSSEGSQSTQDRGFTNTMTTAVNMLTTDPVATWLSGPCCLTWQKAKNIAYDIHHFFKKEEKYTLCLPCMTPSSKGSGGLSANDSYFSRKTSTTMLHNHLELAHMLLYVNKLEEEGWLVQLKLLKATFSSGYTFNTLRATLAFPNVMIDNLPPPPPPKVGNCIPSNLGSLPRADISDGILEFSLKALHDYLVRFIVANDQAIHVVEYLEFQRLLLLLCKDLKDSDIPHHMKMQELVLKAWRDYFVVLKADLKVSYWPEQHSPND